MLFDSYFTSYTKINSKLIKDLNVRPKSIKPLKENKEERLLDIAIRNYFFFFFLGVTAKAKATIANGISTN